MVVSVITINFNNSRELEKTARSIICQTFSDYEWIVIDGGSKDKSVDVIREYERYITYWVSEKDDGVYHAMNKGIKKATGDYLIFLNSGDCFHDENVLRDFTGFVKENPGDVIYGREITIDSQGKELWRFYLPPQPLRLSYFWRESLRHQATFFKRSCFEKFRYNENHKINSDQELYIQLLYNGFKFIAFDRFISIFNGEGMSSSNEYKSLMKQETEESFKTILPIAVYQDYVDLMPTLEVDLMIKTREVYHAKRIYRNLLRVWLYPLCKLTKLSNKK